MLIFKEMKINSHWEERTVWNYIHQHLHQHWLLDSKRFSHTNYLVEKYFLRIRRDTTSEYFGYQHENRILAISWKYTWTKWFGFCVYLCLHGCSHVNCRVAVRFKWNEKKWCSNNFSTGTTISFESNLFDIKLLKRKMFKNRECNITVWIFII